MIITTISTVRSDRQYELDFMPQEQLVRLWAAKTNAGSFDTIPTRRIMIAELLNLEFPELGETTESLSSRY